MIQSCMNRSLAAVSPTSVNPTRRSAMVVVPALGVELGVVVEDPVLPWPVVVG